MLESPIFLDYHAHGPIDLRVAQALGRAFAEHDANPHSGSVASEAARLAVEEARSSLARLLNVPSSGLVFTSGATEANNFAIAGLARHLETEGRCRLVVSAIEHPSVLQAARALEGRFDIQIAPVLRDGMIDLIQLADLVTPETGLVSVAAANHEIGVIQPLKEVAAIARRVGAYVHSDLAQAAGKIEVDLSEIDLASVSAHKMYGPFGVGALYLRRSLQKQIAPVLLGGGQERGLRSGTVPGPLCIAFGVAADLALAERHIDADRVISLRHRLLEGLTALEGVSLNGHATARLPGNLSLAFSGVDAEALVMRLRKEVVLSTGSACTTDALDPSPVLLALGLDRRSAEATVRIGLGRFTTADEVEHAITKIAKAVADLRAVGQRAVA